MCSGMFEVYKNRNILQFAQFFVSQSHLKDDSQMHLACYTGGIFLYDIRAHTYDLSNVQLGNKCVCILVVHYIFDIM